MLRERVYRPVNLSEPQLKTDLRCDCVRFVDVALCTVIKASGSITIIRKTTAPGRFYDQSYNDPGSLPRLRRGEGMWLHDWTRQVFLGIGYCLVLLPCKSEMLVLSYTCCMDENNKPKWKSTTRMIARGPLETGFVRA